MKSILYEPYVYATPDNNPPRRNPVVVKELSTFDKKVQSYVVLTSLLCMSIILASLRSTMAAVSAQSIHSIAYVTAPSQEVAKALARGVVEKKLAACVNIIPQITSVYEWEGKTNEDSEVLMITENVVFPYQNRILTHNFEHVIIRGFYSNNTVQMIKTRTSRITELTSFIKSHHPYDVCEVITTSIEDGNPDYLKWISSVVPEKS